MPRPAKKSLMRSLGEFFGHIAHGVKAPVDPAAGKTTLRRETTEETRDTPQGKVIVRRTTIEELEVRPDDKP